MLFKMLVLSCQSLLLLSLFFVSVFPSPAQYPRHILHERRSQAPPQWLRRSRLEAEEVIPVKIGLSQRNLDRAEDFLYDVAHPRSLKFGQHWTPRQVAETFAPR
jgi:tripeptidyl-peptidase-1